MKNLAFEGILDKRKAEIVTAVLLLVDKVGITGLTTKRIAGEVGFAEGALYKHVESKTGIFEIILDASLQSIDAADKEIAARKLPPSGALGAWFDFIVAFLNEYPGMYRILFSDGLYAEDRTMFQKFKSCILDLNARIRAIIERGIASGEFRSDGGSDLKAVAFLGLILTTFMLWTVLEERSRSYKQTAQPYFDEYIRMLLIPSGTPGEASRG